MVRWLTFAGGVRSGGALPGATTGVGVCALITSTVPDAVDLLPDASIAVNVTVVFPNENTEGAFDCTRGDRSTRSVARRSRNRATNVFVAETGESEVNDSWPGTGNTGGVVSCTSTPTRDVDVWFDEFVA